MRLENKYYKNLQGFTMAELVVSIFIISLISGMFLAGYHYYGEAGNLTMTANKLVSDIRTAQNYALGSKDFNGVTPEGGWGIYFNKNTNADTYIIYANCSDNLKYTEGDEYRTINLPQNIFISSLEIGNNPNYSELHLVFEPPDPTIYICPSSGPCDRGNSGNEGEITISDSSGKSRTIKINIFGLVDIVN